MNITRNAVRRIVMIGIIVGLSLWAATVEADEDRPVIVLNPGHGWWSIDAGQIDPGAVAGDLVEKDINLDVAKQTRELLQRCPVKVYLTREADDPDHTLYDVDEIVNAHVPSVGVSIHANSGSASGAEGWYTVGGYDDSGSQQLAQLMAENIATRLDIPDLRTFPETSNRHGILYIHWWNAPSALVEMAYLQQDATLLRESRRDFARSLAQAILAYLERPVTCADEVTPQGIAIAPYFPGEAKDNEVSLVNDGLVAWAPGQYELVNVDNRYGAAERYPLSESVSPGDSVEWQIPTTAPDTPGIKQQVWQLQRVDTLVGPKIRVYLIVVPEEARELKQDLENRIAAWREQGEQELDKLLEELSRELAAWIEREAEKQLTQCLKGNTFMVGLLLTSAIWPQIHRRRK